jgi:hypothetical protein
MIIFSTCWYILKAKFDKNKYGEWIDNLLNNVKNFKLIIYTNRESYYMLEKYENNENIKIIKLELWEFYNFKYRDFWIKNHEKNIELNRLVDSRVNMLWNEKIFLVKRSYENKYFSGEWYGWIDIGYFRNTKWDIKVDDNWPNKDKVDNLNKDKIYYAKVNNNKLFMNNLYKLISDKNENGLPKQEIPANQISIAGGFFLIYYDKIDWYSKLHDEKVKLYIENNRLIKDDQIIVIDNIFSNFNNFILISEEWCKEAGPGEHQRWFQFQRYLS